MAQNSFTQHCRQEVGTATLAQQLALSLSYFFQSDQNTHLNISLEGDLGAGKTTFARHLIQALGYVGRVKSPTYTLCEPYPIQIKSGNPPTTATITATITAHHFDLYRMKDPLEWQEAGFTELFDEPGFCLVEWPEKAEGTLPIFDIQIHLKAGDDENERNITIEANSIQGHNALEKIFPQ